MLKARSVDAILSIANQHVELDELVLGCARGSDNIIDCVIDRCVVRFARRDGQGVILSGTRFVNCVVKPETNVQANWSRCAWEGCEFHGQYISTHFGQDPLHDGDPYEILIRDCDFSKATMHGCIFDRTDVRTVKFPKWPCFTLLHPGRNRAAWMAAKLPFKHRMIEASSCEGMDAIVFHWDSVVQAEEAFIRELPSIAKPDVSAADPEEVRKALATLDFVRI